MEVPENVIKTPKWNNLRNQFFIIEVIKMAQKYDGVKREHYRIDMYNAKEVSEKGYEAIKTADNLTDPPTIKKIENLAKENGLDTFEITIITERTTRYIVDREND